MLEAATRALNHLAAATGGWALNAAVPLLNLAVPAEGYRILPDIAYGSDPRQRLDLYVPDVLLGPAPILLFFYGGSWQSGSKSIYRAVGQAFASQGIITAVADYRIYPQVRYPAFIEDGALALRLLRDTAGAHGGDSARLFVSGHSAGAYIATMLGVNASYLNAVSLAPSDLRGIVGIAGPYDFLPLYDPVLIDIFGGDRLMATQPIKHARNPAPPMLLAHGTADTTIGAGNSRRMAERLRGAGNRVELVQYPGIGHLEIVVSLAHGFRKRTSLYDDMLRFIREA